LKCTYGMRNVCNVCMSEAMGDVISGIGIGIAAADGIGYLHSIGLTLLVCFALASLYTVVQ